MNNDLGITKLYNDSNKDGTKRKSGYQNLEVTY